MTKAARLRSQGHWSLVVGAIVLIGCIVGIVQLFLYDEVSIRPGHEPVTGVDAAQMLLALCLTGMAIVGFATILLAKARRNLHKLGLRPAKSMSNGIIVKARGSISNMSDDKTQIPIQRFDIRSRRIALVIVSLGLIIGLLGLILLEHFRPEWEAWLEQLATEWLHYPARGGFIIFILTTPLWGLAWCLGRIANRTKAAQRYPPPNLHMIRDTPIISGDIALRRARLLRLAAVLSWILPIICGFWFWWTLTRLSS